LDIRLNWMAIKNFKGIKDLRIDFKGQNVSILGNNATYKSTVYDAFCWVVSGKDSFNRADFGIKPLDEECKEVHFLETEVEIELLVSGKPLRLKKVQTENWVKPHGKTEQEYKGNNTAYFFDEVPMGANNYKAKVDELIGEEIFRLLTNPLYFNLHYKVGKLTDWQSRRKLLFEMCGEISDEEIIARNPSLAKLPEVLDGKSIEDRKAIIAQSIKKLNAEIEKIGPKIDENMRLIPETTIDYTETENRLAGLKMELQQAENHIADANKMVTAIGEKQRKLYQLKNQLSDVKSRIDAEVGAGYKELHKEKTELEKERYRIETEISQLKDRVKGGEYNLKRNAERRKELLDEWKLLNKEKLEILSREFVEPNEGAFICPTCSQGLPEETIKSKIDEMRENFHKNKENALSRIERNLEDNVSSGYALQTETQTLQTIIENCKNEITAKEEQILEVVAKIDDIRNKLQIPPSQPDYTKDAEHVELEGKIKALQAELDKPIEDTTAEARQRKQFITAEIEDCNRILNNRDVVANARARIEELKQSERDLSNQKSRLEGQLNLITEFIKAKANTLTDVMNSKFKHVRFRLFDIQQNGGIVEVCDTMVNTNGKWVPFSDGNTAGRINAGVDIVNALSEHYGVRVPLWVDNRESITDLAETGSQVISLIKPDIRTTGDRKRYGKLNVEVG
jgi:exonuclease SbcC